MKTCVARLMGMCIALAFTALACDSDPATDDQGGGSSSDQAASRFAIGGGIPVDVDPSAYGKTMLDEIQELYPTNDTTVVGVLPIGETAPSGAVIGLRLSNGTHLYLTSAQPSSGEAVEFNGAVLEDPQGNLILRQVNANDGILLSFPTGDTMTFNPSGDDSVQVIMQLNATSPSSSVIFVIDNKNEITMVSDADDIGSSLNEEYNLGPRRIPRNGPVTAKRLAQREQLACDLASGVSNTIGASCAVWSFITNRIGEKAIQLGCLGINTILDEVRGSTPFLAQDEEIGKKLIAGLKIGLNYLCAAAELGWDLKSIFQRLSPPDLFCLGTTLADEGARVITNGESIATTICDVAQRLQDAPEVPPIPNGPGCLDTCETANDGTCDDGGPLSEFAGCALGTDCQDCSVRTLTDPEEIDCSSDGACNLECPRFAPDPDCDSSTLCIEKDVCCPDDGICDISSCTTTMDPDCGNDDFCDRRDMCCDDDNVCDGDCPTADTSCLDVVDDGDGNGNGDQDCGGCPAGEACINNVCGPCNEDSQCLEGELCILGECLEGTDVGEGCETTGCAAGETCCNSECIPFGVPTQALCPDSLQLDEGTASGGVFTPAPFTVTLDSFEVNEPRFEATCTYMRQDGENRVWNILIAYRPESTPGFGSSQGGFCGLEGDNNIITGFTSAGSTIQTITVRAGINAPDRLLDSVDVVTEVLNNALAASVGAECCVGG